MRHPGREKNVQLDSGAKLVEKLGEKINLKLTY